MYSADPSTNSEYLRFASNDAPSGAFPLAKEAARAQAPDRIEPIAADESTPVAKPTPVPPTIPSGPQVPEPSTGTILPPPMLQPQVAPKRSLRQRIARLFGSSQPNAVPMPVVNTGNGPTDALPPLPPFMVDGQGKPVAMVPIGPSPLAGLMPANLGLKTGPALPPDQLPPIPDAPNVLPPSIAKIVPPGPVAAPTPEQLNAISPDLVKAFQKDAFDPNVTPAGGKSVPVSAEPPVKLNPAAKTLEGSTWIRNTDGCVVQLAFKNNRATATVTTTNLPDAPGKSITATVSGEYAISKDESRLYGILTDDVDIQSTTRDPKGELLEGRAEDRLDSPFSVRIRLDGDVLTVQTLRATALSSGYFDKNPGMRTACFGKYEKVQPKAEAPAAPAKARTMVVPNVPDVANEALPVPIAHNRLVVPAERPTLTAALEFLYTIVLENPTAVTAFSTEAGRGIGLWLGRKFDRPDLGAVVGGIVGSALGVRLIEGPKPKRPTPAERVSYWLGVK